MILAILMLIIKINKHRYYNEYEKQNLKYKRKEIFATKIS